MHKANILFTFIFWFVSLIFAAWASAEPVHSLYIGRTSLVEAQDGQKLSPQIAATPDGSVYVVWVEKDGRSRNNQVHISVSNDNGTQFGSPIILSRKNVNASSPQLTATPDGNVYVVWVENNVTNGNTEIKFSGSDTSGERFGRKTIHGDNNYKSLSSSPQIAATKNGNVYVAWVENNITKGSTDILYRGSDTSGERFGRDKILNEVLNKDIEVSSSFSSSPRIAATPDGSVYVVWVSRDEKSVELNEVREHGEIIGHIIRLSKNSINHKVSSPQIAATPDGNVYVVWIGLNEERRETSLYLKRASNFPYDRN